MPLSMALYDEVLGLGAGARVAPKKMEESMQELEARDAVECVLC